MYVDRNENFVTQSVTVNVTRSHPDCVQCEENDLVDVHYPAKRTNSDSLKKLDSKVSHLIATQQKNLEEIIHRYEHLFSDIPSITTLVHHDVDVGHYFTDKTTS